SGRRRHTRFSRDWSSDVCSSDLAGYMEQGAPFNRRTSSADANRLDPQMIIANTRDRAKFDRAKLSAAKRSRPSSPKDPFDLWSEIGRASCREGVQSSGRGRQLRG